MPAILDEYDIDPLEAGGTMMLAVTLLAVGAFLGVELTTQLVLSDYGPLQPVPWLDAVRTVRSALFGVIVAGFVVLVVLDYLSE